LLAVLGVGEEGGSLQPPRILLGENQLTGILRLKCFRIRKVDVNPGALISRELRIEKFDD
jgi:hypothetical protein